MRFIDKMNRNEQRVAASLAAIFAFRMFGLFIILPIFAPYANTFTGATPTLVGIALGIYGLTQALLQLPLGMISDRVGRKPVIATGLVIFAIGSVVAAMSTSITGIIIGRALQGTGAIGSTVIALLADLTREQHRTKAMAVIGITIGMTFTASMIIGPLANAWVGLSGIFWITALLAISGLVIIYTLPKPLQRPQAITSISDQLGLLGAAIQDPQLMRLDASILLLHAILTASFVAIPICILQNIGLGAAQQWHLYLPALIVAFLATAPCIILAERRQWLKPMLLGAIAALGISQLVLWQLHSSLWGMGLCLVLFFTAFTLLEAILPSWISKQVQTHGKGTAMGVYSTAQYFGTFLGGAVGGWLYGHANTGALFLACAGVASLWLLFAMQMPRPRNIATHILPLPEETNRLSQQLRAAHGVIDIQEFAEQGVAHVRVDRDQIDEKLLLQLSVS